jgi:hypothetical protein
VKSVFLEKGPVFCVSPNLAGKRPWGYWAWPKLERDLTPFPETPLFPPDPFPAFPVLGIVIMGRRDRFPRL